MTKEVSHGQKATPDQRTLTSREVAKAGEEEAEPEVSCDGTKTRFSFLSMGGLTLDRRSSTELRMETLTCKESALDPYGREWDDYSQNS